MQFTQHVFDERNDVLANALAGDGQAEPRRVLAVVDDGLVPHYPALPDAIGRYARAHDEVIDLAGLPMLVPGGEAAKNDPALVTRLHRAIADRAIDRHAYVLAIGGGAVLDLVGFAAATAHRGVRLIRIPTTVLAQNDSGVGVKNGVNAFGSKNFVGTFAPPWAVINDATFLATLDDRDWSAGVAEAIKVALIKDPSFFERLEADAVRLAPPTRDAEAMAALIHRCAALHVEHIAGGDPFEMGSSRPLDFGHWAAHRLERLTDFALRHGEAVAIGIALDVTYSFVLGWIDEPTWNRILELFERLGLDLYVPELGAHLDDSSHPDGLFRGLHEFREHLGGRLTLMLLRGIGRPVEVHAVDEAAYRTAVDLLRRRSSVDADVT